MNYCQCPGQQVPPPPPQSLALPPTPLNVSGLFVDQMQPTAVPIHLKAPVVLKTQFVFIIVPVNTRAGRARVLTKECCQFLSPPPTGHHYYHHTRGPHCCLLSHTHSHANALGKNQSGPVLLGASCHKQADISVTIRKCHMRLMRGMLIPLSPLDPRSPSL